MDEGWAHTLLATTRASLGDRQVVMTGEIVALDPAANGSNRDEHDPESATIAFERVQPVTLMARGHDQRHDVDWALARLAAHAYGRCEPINDQRLQALPTAPFCVRCVAAVWLKDHI